LLIAAEEAAQAESKAKEKAAQTLLIAETKA
jgi:hypothetical protein